MPTIKLKSSDNEIFETDVEAAKCSGTIKNMLEVCGLKTDENTIVPLPNVNAATLRKILEWANYHKNDPPLPESDEEREWRTDDISEWDTDFLRVDLSVIIDIMTAANYLDIRGLEDLTCKALAHIMKGKTAEEIRQILNIENDFTPEEEEWIRLENLWSEKIKDED